MSEPPRKSWSKQIRYRFGDIDDAGIAYYPKLLHAFHCVFEDWWSEALGRPYSKLMREDKLGLPAVALDVEFYSPVRYGDEPLVHVAVLRVGESSVQFAFWMTQPRDDRPLCRARVTTAAVDIDTMRKRRLPDVWRERFADYSIDESGFPGGRRPGDRAGSGRKSRGK